ncbi:ABC transporter ATP-binding protein [Bacteroidota bacterium]
MSLKAENIVKSFGRKKVLRGLSFDMKAGTLNGIVGENGSGKSTLLKIIVRQWQADKGKVIVKGRIGYCPQEPLIFSQLTVEEHFRYFSAAYGLEKTAWQSRCEYLLEHFNFKQYRSDKVAELSGGTQQKLNLSLALMHQPELLILDEPYNGFDWDTYLCFWEFTDLMQQNGCAILIVTHLLNETDRFDRIYNLKNGYLE